MNEESLSTKIHAAKQDILDAEQALDRLVREIAVAARAEKTTVTANVEEALGKLRGAIANLDDLESELAALARG